MRVVHEVSYFATVTQDNAQQRSLLEKFIDELLTINRQRLMQEKPPSTYREAKMVAVDVVTNYNGRGGELCRKTDVYGALREADKKERSIKALQDRVASLEASLRTANRNWGDEGHSNRGGRSSGRGSSTGRGRGGGAPPMPKGVKRHRGAEENEYVIDRLQVCREFNERGCGRGGHCTKLHGCNAVSKTDPNKACRDINHKGSEHK